MNTDQIIEFIDGLEDDLFELPNGVSL
jgi:hypothetical protein